MEGMGLMVVRRLTVGFVAGLCALVGLLTLWGVPAQATITHEYLSRFSEVPAEGPSHEAVALPGPVTGLESMTVDSGHVWVAEGREGSGGYRVDEFSAATGGFLAQPLHAAGGSPEYLGVAVGHLAGEPEPQLYVAEYDSGGPGPAVGVYSTAGVRKGTWTGAETLAGPFGVIFTVAVDDSTSLTDWAAGNAYVPVGSQKVVDVFKPVAGGAEKYVTQLTGTCATPASCTENTFNAPRQVVVDSANGDVLVGDGSVVDVFEPTVLGEYAFVRQLTGTPTGPFNEIAGITVDGGSGDIYVAEANSAVVDQFSSEGVYVGHLTGTPAGPFSGRLNSVAVDSASHDLYVGERGFEFGEQVSAVDVFGPGIRVPDVATEPASEVKSRSATLNGTVNPDKAGAATCQFEYGTSKSFGQVAPCAQGVSEGESPVPVHAEVANLQPDTTYFYRLQASNANGTNLGEPSQDQQFTTSGPGIHGESASVVTSGSATLDATIDPHGAPTSYYFQYGTSTSYGASVPLAPGLGLGSGEGDLSVNIHIHGLVEGTTYHYRVVVVGEPGGELVTVEGADETFTTQAAANQFALPDGRSWEMVTPPNKQGAGLKTVSSRGGVDIQASVSGGAITYAASAPFVVDPAGSSSPEDTQVYSVRGAPGNWASQDITTPHNTGAAGPANLSEYRLFSPDLSLGLVDPVGSTPLPPLPSGSEKTIYLRKASGEYEALVTTANIIPAGAKFAEGQEGGFEIASATPDLSHVVLSTRTYLEPNEAGLYEWAGGRLQFASVLPHGELVKEAALGDSTGSALSALVRRAVSSDGSRVVWESRQNGEGGKERLYLRDMVRGETVQVDAAQGAAETYHQSIYRTADSTGSRVFFTSSARLTADARLAVPQAGVASGHQEDLYVFEVTSGHGEPLAGKLTDLTVDRNAYEIADVRGVIETSEDGSSVYFVANGVLGDGAEHGARRGDCEQGGESLEELQRSTCNLYVERYDPGSRAWEVTFIAALSGADQHSWSGLERDNLSFMMSRVSPNGSYLAFMSDLSLTGYDNRDANSGVADEEVFLYDANTGRVVCTSCNPTGARPVGVFVGEEFKERLIDWRGAWQNRWLAGSIPGWTVTTDNGGLYQSRYLSNSGRLFFNDADMLVPADVNGREDVYQYEPAGVGGCQGPGYGQGASVVFDESIGGCVGLISSGTSSEESVFMDASETGGDVFFMTLSQLSPQDYDRDMDVYDAHECTAGSPCAAASSVGAPPCVTGDGCKAAPSPQPAVFGSPSSATFSGAGNVTAPVSKPTASRKAVKCKRGRVKKHGRCVKRQAKRASRPARRGK